MREQLMELLKNVLNIDSLSELDSTETIPTWDSVHHINLIMAIEEKFGIQFEPEEITELTSYRAIAEAVDRYRASGATAP